MTRNLPQAMGLRVMPAMTVNQSEVAHVVAAGLGYYTDAHLFSSCCAGVMAGCGRAMRAPTTPLLGVIAGLTRNLPQAMGLRVKPAMTVNVRFYPSTGQTLRS